MDVELEWTIGGRLPPDHGYHLYSALSHYLPRALHESDGWAIAPVELDPGTFGLSLCRATSRLRIRCEAALAGTLAGAIDYPGGLELEKTGGLMVTFGGPRIQPILAGHTRTFSARLVTLRHAIKPSGLVARPAFRDGLIKQLRELDIDMRYIDVHVGEPGEGRVAYDTYGGYGVTISGISRDRDAWALLARGVGGRRKMGAGWFDPA